jgi:hypothetical protein
LGNRGELSITNIAKDIELITNTVLRFKGIHIGTTPAFSTRNNELSSFFSASANQRNLLAADQDFYAAQRYL